MPKYNLWTKSVPRVEYDHRAREARRRLAAAARQLPRRGEATGYRLLRVLREAFVAVSGGGKAGDQGNRSSRGQRPGGMPPAVPCFAMAPAMGGR